MSTAAGDKAPGAATPAAHDTDHETGRTRRRPWSVLHRTLRRVVAFVVPPDDKIAQTWRWML